jgi:hypothetical protein
MQHGFKNGGKLVRGLGKLARYQTHSTAAVNSLSLKITSMKSIVDPLLTAVGLQLG